MKSFIKITYALLITVVIWSCESELDQNPITQRDASSFFSNETEIESAILGTYATLQYDDANNVAGLYNFDIIGAGEIQSDNTFDEVPANDDGRFGQLDQFTTIPGNNLVGLIWQQSYVAIQRANVVLNRIGDIPFEDEIVKNNRIGEMNFVRALMYFNLVRLYGDVPLVTLETIDPNDAFGQGRTSMTEVYSKIETDLLTAIPLLPNTNISGRPSKGAAQALLGKIYLTLGQFGNAATQLQAVVSSGNYSLVNDVTSIFGEENEDNSEMLFVVKFTSGLNGDAEGSSAFSQYSPSGTVANAKGHNLPTVALYNLYDDSDLRKGSYVDITGGGVPFAKKWTINPINANDGGSDTVVIRYSDVVLMLAEALNESDGPGVADLLNSIRSRAGLPNTTATSKTELRDAIALERRFELVGEGHRWFDLLRTGTAIETMNTWFAANGINIIISENDLLLPIPQSQVDTDPAIVQNPGY